MAALPLPAATRGISLSGRLSPRITTMIRADHSHVMMLFHKYAADTSPARKRSIVEAACLAIEIHAQLEEEIFYPALLDVAANEPALAKSKPEHDRMRNLIERLRGMEPGSPDYDARFMELVRDVMHHVADEESTLLPVAERLLRDRLGELGARMTRRRLQLAAPHAGQMALHTARAMPAGTMLVAGSLLAGGYLVGRALMQRRH